MTREKFKTYNGVFDEQTLKTLAFLKKRKLYDELLNPIKTGKEADVYLAKKGEKFVAIKIFRINTANFKKIFEYIQYDYRFKNIKGNKRKIILAWCQKEFRNLLLLEKNGVRCPKPIKQLNNCLIMEYIDGGMLKDTPLTNPLLFFNELIRNLSLMVNEAKLFHVDFSEFNVLVKDEKPYIIDVGQSIQIKQSFDFDRYYHFLIADLKNIINHFNKVYDLDLEIEKVIKMVIPSNSN